MKARPILFSGPMVISLLAGTKSQTRRIIKPQPEIAYVERNGGWLEKKTSEGGNVFLSTEWGKGKNKHGWLQCPYGKPGDLLAVKESAWMWCERRPNGITKTGRQKWHYVPLQGAPIHYQATASRKPEVSITHPETGNEWGWKLKVGRFMPRWASRLTLELTEVRVERLQDISEADAIAEGVSEAAFRSGLIGNSYVPTDRPLDEFWCSKCHGQGVHAALGPNLGVTEVDCCECDTAEKLYRNLWNSINGPGSWDANPWVWVLSFRVQQKNVDALLAERGQP